MALSASQSLQKRKEQKFQRELNRALSSVSSRLLYDYLGTFFSRVEFTNYSSELFVKMVTASKFGGENAVGVAGNWFSFASILQLVNVRLSGRSAEQLNIDPGSGDYVCSMYTFSEIFNIVVLGQMDKKLTDQVVAFDINDFSCRDDISSNLFLDSETQSYGFFIAPRPCMKIDDLKVFMRDELGHVGVKYDGAFEGENVARLRIRDLFDSGKMEYISNFEFIFGTVDKLLGAIRDRKKHDVTSHLRHLKSGKITEVREHKRKTPLKLVYSSDTITDHIVYKVKDANGKLRYIGEGKSDRWKHVNSGASHNIKINEHFFTKGLMDVEIVYEGLSKPEALGIEKILLKNYAGQGLWNSKDYEPFTAKSILGISEDEIQEYLNG